MNVNKALMSAALVMVLVLLAAGRAGAIEKYKDGFYHTGSGIRVKEIAFIDVNVYEINHYMKELPPKRSKQAVIEMDVDKKMSWKMLRDVEGEKLRDALKTGFEMNGFKDAAKIQKFTKTFKETMAEGSRVTIIYDAAKKTTTIAVDGGGTATVEGADFMKATWSIWFGKIDQPTLGDSMIRLLP